MAASERQRECRVDSGQTITGDSTDNIWEHIRHASCLPTRDVPNQGHRKRTLPSNYPVMRSARYSAAPAISSASMNATSTNIRIGVDLLDMLTDVGYTLQDIALHSIFLVLLAMRVFALPLVYATQKFAGPKTTICSLTFNLLHFSIQRCRRMPRKEPATIPSLYTSCERIFESVKSIMRTLKTLYQLCQVLQQEPDLFSQKYSSRNGSQSLSLEAQYTKSSVYNIPRMEEEESGEATPPPTASQVYHASLAAEKSLDQILASFEDRSSTKSSYLNDGRSVAGTHPRSALREDFPSIQSTPDHFKGPKLEPIQSSPISPRTAEVFSRPLTMHSTQSQPVSTFNYDTKEVARKDEGCGNGFKIIAPSAEHTTWKKAFEVCEHARDVEGVRRCATCASRESRSRIPKSKSIPAFVRRSFSADLKNSAISSKASPNKLRKPMRY